MKQSSPVPEETGKSKKSAFVSTPPRKPSSLKRSRALARGGEYEPLSEDHLPYLWIGYKAGVFRGCDDIPEGLDPAGFDHLMGTLYGNALNMNATIIAVKALSSLKKGGEKKMIPVGLAVLSLFQHVAYPHVFWMPWASPRNKLESAIKFLVDLKKESNVMIISPPERVAYYSHLGKYGILRRVGILKNHIKQGEDAVLFEGVREWA